MRFTLWILAFATCFLPSVSQADYAPNHFFQDPLKKTDDEDPATQSKCVSKDYYNVWNVSAKVIRVVDGDTVVVNIKGQEINIRFLTIDTPELHFQGKSQGIWGEKAAAALSRHLPVGTAVDVELEKEKCDKYGRMLGHVWKGDKNINREQVMRGYAVNYCIWPNDTHCEEYGALAQKNYDASKGMFSDPDLDLPYEYRRKERGEERTKFVGNVLNYEVYEPNRMEEVDVGARIFFIQEKQIHKPYELIGN